MSSSKEGIEIASGATVVHKNNLRGVISIGSGSIIHPNATIIADAGPVIIGENNLLMEQAAIIHSFEDKEIKSDPVPITVGVGNIFKDGCEIRAKQIGNFNVFESNCFVGHDMEIGNGCIIGAGCQIKGANCLLDQTVITGTNRTALGTSPDQEDDDLERQSDELQAVGVIFTEEFCSFTTGSEVQTKFEAHVHLPKDFLLLLSNGAAITSFTASYLPPILLTTVMPKQYPSKEMPQFTLSCSWLGQSKLRLLTQELEKLWQENQCEILYIWCSFLKEQSHEFLNLGGGYDLKENYPLNQTKPSLNQESNGNDSVGTDDESVMKQATETLKMKITAMKEQTQHGYLETLFSGLKEYNTLKLAEEFKRNVQECKVCYIDILGEKCKQLGCGHTICLQCLRELCEVNITLYTVDKIVCPEINCPLEIPPYVVQDMVSKEMYDKYDRLMLNKALDEMSKMNYCPLLHCQYPVESQGQEPLAVCPNCSHAFCIYCRRPYHGVEGCRLHTDKKELIDEYKNGDEATKLKLEKRYGKKQLSELVSATESEVWLSENSKQCPSCSVKIEKNQGCNKMICWRCSAKFCWVCLRRLSAFNPYIHFSDPKSPCYDQLFEGVDVDAPLDMALLVEGEDGDFPLDEDDLQLAMVLEQQNFARFEEPE